MKRVIHMTEGRLKAIADIKWLGPTVNVTHVGEFMILEVLHNQISNRKEDRVYFHIYSADGTAPRNEHYPSLATCLLGLALILEGKKNSDAVFWMAKIADIAQPA